MYGIDFEWQGGKETKVVVAAFTNFSIEFKLETVPNQDKSFSLNVFILLSSNGSDPK